MTTLAALGLRVSVVICAYTEERWDDLCAAVASALRQTRPPTEVIVVIDHCPPLLERARLAFPRALVVENAGPAGLSGGRNTGIARARGDVVAFLDDDAAADERWLERLLAAYEEPGVVGAGGRVVPRWSARRPDWFPPAFDWVVGCSHAGMPSSTRPVRNFVGANMSFRRDLLVSLGGFSERLGRNGTNSAGCEETELCIRAQRSGNGVRLVYEPGAVVHHRVPPARGTWRYFLRRCYGEGRSKAEVVRLAGRSRALADERSYLVSTVPRAVAASLGEAARGRPSRGLAAVAALAGTGATFAGYLRGRLSLAPVAGLAVLAGALALWVHVLVHGVDLARMSDFGLVSVLPAAYFLSLGLLTAGFAWWVRRAPAHPLLLAAHLVALLAVLHLTPALLYGTLRYSWAWKHVAITGFVIDTHGVDLTQPIPSLVAYQDWPGFFTLNATLTSGSGLSSALGYAGLAPFVSELAYAGPLALISGAFTSDVRLRWTALWLFYLGNWIGQDYFSPQGFAFFLYLVVLALCLRYLPGRHDVGEHGAADPTARRRRRAAYGLVLLCTLAIACTHQLTPFMVVTALAALALGRRLYYRSLPAVALAVSAAWVLLAGHTFIATNFPSLSAGLGDLFSNASVNQFNAAYASPDQLLISRVDRLLTAWICLVALVGVWRNWRSERRRSWLAAALLCVSPVPALLGNSYGGEIVFRVYLFALPFLALLGAAAFHPARRRASRLADGAKFAVAGALLAAFAVSYYGKERVNYFSPNEVAATARFYALAPPGSYVTGLVGDDTWPLHGYEHYTTYWYTQVGPKAVERLLADPVGTLLRAMRPYRHAYLLLTATDAAVIGEQGLLPPGSLARIRSQVLASGHFRVVVSTPTVLALELVHHPSRGTP
ncbi:MAG TPA: glycosyltransferase [Acidimicrobiales bacterium]|nr:glycosyltransferase [Acidimicrobiales bacterium]